MNITVLGASGKTGTELVKQSLAAGHNVNGLVRQEGRLEKRPHLNIIFGDATNASDIAEASKNSDVIVSALGDNSPKSTLMSNTVKAVIAASKDTGLKRFILMSTFGVGKNEFAGGMKLMAGMMKSMFKDKVTSETMLRQSSLDWTIVHPTVLTDQPEGSGLRVVPEAEKLSLKHKIARADVAAWILKEIENNAYVKADVTISK